MEKYTVDIDKVLDDFEETEALKIDNSHKNSTSSLKQSPFIKNYNEENEFYANETEVTYQNIVTNDNDANSNEKKSCSDGDVLSQNVVNDKTSKYLEIPDGCGDKIDSFNENVPELGHLAAERHLSSIFSPASTSEISQEISSSQDCSQSLIVNSTQDNVVLDRCDFLNTVKSSIKSVSESHLIIENKLMLPQDFFCKDTPFGETSHDLHLVESADESQSKKDIQEFEEIEVNSCSSDLQLEYSSDISNLESHDMQQNFLEANTSATNAELSDIEVSKTVADENLKDELKVLRVDTELKAGADSASSSSAAAAAEGCDVGDHEAENKVQILLKFDSETNEPYFELHGKEEDIERTLHPQGVEFHREILDEIVDISSEDSGVSSEDGNNSPLFFYNNQIVNGGGGDAHVDSNQEACAAAKMKEDPTCDSDTNLKEDLKSKMDFLSDGSGETEKKESTLEIQNVGDTAVSNSSMNSQSPNKFTGARPKLEVNQSVLVASNAETKEQSETENIIVKTDNVNNNESPDQCDETVIISEKSEADNCDISDKSCAVLPDNINNIESSVSCHVNDTEIKCDKMTLNTESLSVGIENDCSVISDAKTDNFPQRLARPTTLDLPSRHVAASLISSESNGDMTESNDLLSVSCPDFIPDETPIDDSASEPSPSMKQQPRIGLVKPFWIPDADAPNCMHCGVKFTVIKRRHHCRACGKVLCSRCCNLKAKLAYLNREDRICHPCFEILSSTSQIEDLPSSTADSQSSSSCGSSPNFSPSPQIPNANFSDKSSWRPHPNNPDDYCSTIPPLQQIQLSGTRPPPTVMVPIGVLKRGNKPRREPKQVIFSDGIRPGGDLTDLTEPADVIPAYRRMNRKRVEKAVLGDAFSSTGSSIPFTASQRIRQKRVLVSDDEGPLPPIVLQIDNDKVKDEKLDWNQLLDIMQDDDQKPVNFALLKNMHLFVKLIKLDCCFGKECWCFTSHGLCAVGQDEVMVILERIPGESTLPRGIIKLFTHIYDSASKGSTFEDLGHIIFPEHILGSCDHRGFLFVRPTFQCLSKLIVPNTPFLVAILIHKWEVPWAKVFPLRLMLRLGAECRYYPCALVSVRHRKPVFFEIGQTIMSVLADLRNYQFTIPVIPGLVVHMEEKKTCVNIPRNRYEKVMKVLNSNNVEHVLALGSNFSSEADSHLVCMQKEEGDYQTQAINIENTTRRVIGASFIVFSGALKSSSGLSAKFSIVEDGLLVQIPQETMVALHMALRDMKDLTVECGQINAEEPEEVVIIQWTRDDKKYNIGVRSPIDCKSLEGIQSVRIHTSTDYAGDNYLIRWTEVFFLEVDERSSNSIQHELVDPCRLAETIAQSCCMALAPYLDQLAESELTKIGLRVTLDSERDRVEYDIGARGKPLPAVYMNALDCGLIPVILRLSGSAHSEPVSLELIFYILIK